MESRCTNAVGRFKILIDCFVFSLVWSKLILYLTRVLHVIITIVCSAITKMYCSQIVVTSR